MFLRLPFQDVVSVQQTVLVINTILLIAVLIVVEVVYSEQPKARRRYLKYFWPLLSVLVGLLIYAAYKQVGKA